MHITVVIPVFNERDCIDELVERVQSAYSKSRILFVDNGSTDGTLERIACHDVDVLKHAVNQGYGKSLHEGVLHASSEVVVTIDGDLEYPPECIPSLIERIEGKQSVVYGSRFLNRMKGSIPVTTRCGNLTVTRLFNAMYGQHLTDLYTGVKAFRRSEIAKHRFRRNGFGYVVEMAAYLSRTGTNIVEIPISYAPRSRGSSKMSHLSETFKALYWMILFRVLPINATDE